MRINQIFCYLLLLFFAGCKKSLIIREKLYVNPHTQKACNPPLHQECEYITVWVHGTRLAPRAILHNIFHSPNGLVPACSFDTKYHLRAIADTLTSCDPINYSSNYMFLFGWPGTLNFQDRRKAAQDFYNELKPVIESYKQKHGRSPKIRIITHSHGGNVVLNLAKIKDEASFVIDELIVLACPVQEDTASLIKDPIFKEVFVLYSSCDLLQVIDPQGLYSHQDDRPLLSQRRFPLQNNITQVKIKLNGRALLHADFIRLQFISVLPQIIAKMRDFHDQLACQGHLTNEQAEQILSVYT